MFQPNSVIAGRYQVVRLVGQGGMSNLYLAYDRKYNGATVVVKEMTASYSDPKEQQMAVDLFHREAKLLASLNHRHIPKVFDYFQFAGKYYLSMEYIDGVDLAVKLEETKGPLPEKQVLEWGEQVAQVLFYLHKHDPPIVFRDVKPSNIMISSQGVKLIDFGIARHFDQAKKGDTMRIGSPGYAPPEQYAAQTDPRSDIYALGVTLHHALTGRDPTATNTPFLVPPARDLNPNLQESTAAMLARATQLDPSDRYQSALEMRKDIKHILQRGNQSTRVVGAPPSLPQEGPVSASPDASTPDPSGNQSAPQQAAAPANNSANSSAPAQAAQATASQAPAANGSGGLATSANTNAQAPQSAPKKKKKRFSFGRLLLTACLFAVVACGTALAVMDSTARDRILSQVKQRVETLVGDLRRGENPEDKLRQSLLSGDPNALLPLFQSSDFQGMSKEKQELFRLNLLAAGSAGDDLRVIHLLLPESQDDPSVWEVSSAALGAINGSGGLNNNLYVIVPTTYPQDGLARTLQSLMSEKEGRHAGDSFLVIGGENEQLPEAAPEHILFLSGNDTPGRTTIARLNDESLADLFSLQLDTGSQPTVWGLPGPAPASAIQSQTPVQTQPDKEKLAEMLAQASAAGGRVILLASDAAALQDSSGQGKVLVLATGSDELKSLGQGLEGQAIVLSSPFETASPGAVRLQPQKPLKPSEARLFDALLLSAIKPDQAFHGLTIKRDSKGEFEKKTPVNYRWEQGSWLPSFEEKGNNR